MSTKIAWTDESWNPVTGCTPVSEGCAHCYAKKMNRRFPHDWAGGLPVPFSKVALHPDRLETPLRWRKPRMVFVPSMGDLFHEDVPDDFIAGVFLVIARCGPTYIVPNSPRHTFQVLTKRAERMRDFVHTYRFPSGKTLAETPLENVWLGVSVENQARADERIPLLLDTPAAVRFVSVEPLLGPLDLRPWLVERQLGGYTPGLDWVIMGGESGGPPERRLVERCDICAEAGCKNGKLGPGVHEAIRDDSERGTCYFCGCTGWRPKPEALEWARSLRDQCQAAGVPFFFKQWGPRAGQGALLDGREHKEMPP